MFRRKIDKAPRGKSESLWSLHIGIFQTFLSIIPPKWNEAYSQERAAGKAEIMLGNLYQKPDNGLITDSK
jgi:hypothetical protein